MGKEKECRWYFGNEGPSDIGPNDPIVDKFKGRPYYSIIREATQNTLDVRLDVSSTVIIRFNWFELDRKSYPNLFKIEKHIKAAEEYYSTNPNAKKLFGDMLSYLNGKEDNLKKLKISCLKISESNTEGMEYKKGVSDSPFQGFLRSQGNSIKTDLGAGGSFGYGKGAYFALSPIKTVIVSTKTKDGNLFMEGCTRLSTHKDERGNKLSSIGYYDNNDGEPITNIDKIPDIFKRDDYGTDFNIIGLWPEKDRKSIMVRTVLNNFWLAIWDKNLIVEIDDIVINKDNLEQVIDDYFPMETETGSSTDIESWNPKPYFKAVKYADSNEQFQVFPKKLKTLCEVKLYVYLNKGLPNKVSFFRTPKMVVYKGKRRDIINGYAAVFVCEDKKGNVILKDMENPAHNEWKKENYPKDNGKISPIAKNAELELNRFIRETLKMLSKTKIGDKTSVLGLEEYLFSTEELLEKYEDRPNDGYSPSLVEGSITNEVVDDETGTQTTEINAPPVKVILTKTEIEKIKEEADVEPDGEGDLEGTGGGGNGGVDPEPHPVVPGHNEPMNVSPSEEQTQSKLFLNVNLRVAAQTIENKLYHVLILSSPKHAEKVELQLLVGSDNDRDDGIDIVETDNGIPIQNVLENVQLEEGRNIIKIRFKDGVKHSIKVKAYEIK